MNKRGIVGCRQALDWTEDQYEAFAGWRRFQAEHAAEARHFEDLHNFAESLKSLKPTTRVRVGKDGGKE